MSTTRRTIFKGIAKSRKGRPSIGLQTLINRAKSAQVSDEEAIEAAELLTKKRSPLRHLEAGSVSGALAPAIQAVGRGTQALIDAKRGRFGAARKALTATTRGEVAKNIIGGTLLGTGIRAAHEGIQLQRAKDTYRDFLAQHGSKSAGISAVVQRLRAQGFDPAKPQIDDATGLVTRYAPDVWIRERDEKHKKAAEALVDLAKTAFSMPKPPGPDKSVSADLASKAQSTGRFKGVATPKSLKPPGPPPSKIAINPRRSVHQAINAFRS